MSTRSRVRRLAVAVAAAVLVLAPAGAASAVAAGETEVVIVHGVPGLEVDILVNGAPTLFNVNFGAVTTVTLPSGTYDIALRGSDDDDIIIAKSFTLAPRTSVTLAAHLKADGSPTLAAYGNQNSGTGIQPFHLAAFGPVDILAGGAAALSGVTNGQTARIDVPGGTTVPGVGIAVPGSKEAALPVGDVTVPANTLVLAYAIGSGDGGSLRVVTAAVGVHTPSSVPSGSAGLASNGLPALVVALMALGALGIAAPAMAMRRR